VSAGDTASRTTLTWASLGALNEQLIRIMFNNIDYLTKKATFKQVNPEFPITQEIPDSDDPKVFNGKRAIAQAAIFWL
jgi:hypothetical protein